MEFDRRYEVYPVSQASSLDWSKFTQTFDTCLKSLDGTQFIVQFKGEPGTDTIAMTHQEVMVLKNTEAWKPVTDEI